MVGARESWVRLPDREMYLKFCFFLPINPETLLIYAILNVIKYIIASSYSRSVSEQWTSNSRFHESSIHDSTFIINLFAIEFLWKAMQISTNSELLNIKVLILSSKNTFSIRIRCTTSVRRTYLIVPRNLQSLTRRYNLVV